MSALVRRLPNGCFECAKQLRVGMGIRKWPSRRVQRRHAALRAERSAPALHSVEPLADPASDARILFGRRAHQRHAVGLWTCELCARVALGHACHGPEIHHVERAARADIGHARADHRRRTVLGGRQARRRPADRQTSVVVMSMTPESTPESTSFSIDCPPTPVAWNTRHSKSSSSASRSRLDARRGHAEHGEADRRLVPRPARFDVLGVGARAFTMPTIACGPIGEDLARYRVETGDVGDGVKHHDVRRPDVWRNVAGRDRRDKDFGHADRQRPHRRRDQEMPRRSPPAESAADPAVASDRALERFGHRGDGGAAFAGETALGPPRKYAAIWCGGTSAGDGPPEVDRSTKSTRTPAEAI